MLSEPYKGTSGFYLLHPAFYFSPSPRLAAKTCIEPRNIYLVSRKKSTSVHPSVLYCIECLKKKLFLPPPAAPLFRMTRSTLLPEIASMQ
jgi:hypothetical protein